MTQRIERFFGKYAFENITHRIELFLKKDDSQNCTLLFNMTQRNWTHFLRKEYFYFFKIYDSNKLILFGKHDSKNWTLLSMTQRIEPFLEKEAIELKLFYELFFQYDSQKCIFFFNMTQRIDFFTMIQRIQSLKKKVDAKNWRFFLNMTQRIQLFSWIWRKEFNFFHEYDAKNWTFFFWLKEFYPFLNATQRMQPSSNKTQRIEPSLLDDDSKNCIFENMGKYSNN